MAESMNMHTPTTEEIIKELRFEASIYVGSSTSIVCGAAADRLEELAAKQPRWISVEEGLPSGWLMIDEETNYREPEEYLVHIKGCEFATVAHCIDGVFTPLDPAAWFEDPITHWAHMPEPPKEDEGA